MNERILKYFLTIIEEGNITKAANRLNMSQPPLSKQIKQLEEELGVKLFIRGKKNIQLTEAGKFLKNKAEEIISSIEITERQMGEFKKGAKGIVNIGAVEAVAINYLPEIIKNFSKENSDICFQIWSGSTEDILDRIDKGHIDVAFLRPSFDEYKYNSFKLLDDEWNVIIPLDHQLAKSEFVSIDADMLKGEKLIIPSTNWRIEELHEWFSKNRLDAYIYCYYNVLSIAKAMVKERLGVALVLSDKKKLEMDNSFVVKKLIPTAKSSVYILSSKSRYMSESCKKFLNYLTDMI